MIKTHPYLSRHLQYPLQLDEPVHPELNMVIVIPSYNEYFLLDTLDSLWKCERPAGAIEVVIIVNGNDADDDEVLRQNQKTFWDVERWKRKHQDERLRFHVLNYESLPAHRSGAVMARRFGMDEAVHRLSLAGNEDGIIINLDADCLVAENYLTAIEEFFSSRPTCDISGIYFEFPLKGPEHPRLYDGITRIELAMRYMVHAKKYAGIPYAGHQLWTALAQRSSHYQQQAGKLDISLIHLNCKITTTTVFPSPRMSQRIGYGTGSAVKDWVEQRVRQIKVPDPQIFSILRVLFDRLPQLYNIKDLNGLNDILIQLPQPVLAFLSEEEFIDEWLLLSRKRTYSDFEEGFFRWFNDGKVMQFVLMCQREFHPDVPVDLAAYRLLLQKDPEIRINDDLFLLLELYRKLDQQQELKVAIEQI